ncbi:MAG: hypothetical protein H6721_00830 [Sandaracinus sp.]|nr:hypothetical protein [Sandaracinus sp.]MCB9623659.1 hypothetical protein [Sandaracinus sp.]MCB9630688.1 hypothetical protein [Sandaracinus sp.]
MSLFFGCSGSVSRPLVPPNDGVHSFANGCYTLDAARPGSERSRWLVVNATSDGFEMTGEDESVGARLHLRAADLGTYLLYDAQGFYVTGEGEGEVWRLGRVDTLESDLTLLDDSFVSPAEWELSVSTADEERFALRHRASGRYLTHEASLTEDESDAATITLYPATGCTEYPELTVDAEGEVDGSTWEDGDVYGFVDSHSHPFSNYGFGGAGMFHGSPFHRLGVEHALPACNGFHGFEGRRDLIAYAFSGFGDFDTDSLVAAFISGRTPEANHMTDGYPTFSDWPNAWNRATHQTQYWRWIERAYRAGLRLMIAHATTNSVLCELISGIDAQPRRYSCNDMVAVQREVQETYALERYIDAQSGGPGEGWFRVVRTPAEAREVISQGKLAVVLGIETSNLFDCFLTPREGFPTCDADYVRGELDRFHELGIRALFPVHKFDNAFSAGDGDRRVGQIGSFVNSGHWSNFVTDCPPDTGGFDRGPIVFGGLNMPRDEYLAPPPNDTSGFGEDPVGTVTPFLSNLQEPGLEGDHCQATGLTALGETLLQEMMLRGMIVEVDHLPRRAYARAYELLVENDYPAMGTHGRTNGGQIYELGGMSITGLGRCGEPGVPGAMGRGFVQRIDFIREHGGYPAEGFGFDLNGFAGAPRPRFGPNSGCSQPQENPITYPFESFRGDVTFTEPQLGERTVDFNEEGMLHLGLVAEYIEDARRDGMTDEQLEPLFRSAEAYLRMWERAEARGAALRMSR